jgi:hypothetical protein
MLKKTIYLPVLSFFCIIIQLKAQSIITVNPQEYTKALSNPLMGFRPDLNKAGNPAYPFPTIVRDYIKWSEIESNATDGVQKIINFCNARWANLPAQNVKVIPRVYVDWDSSIGNEYWPADILTLTGRTAADPALWRQQLVKDRLVKLIEKLGVAWNKDPRVAWVQTGLIGYWGEQENPVGVNEEGYAKLLGEAFTKAFPDKKLVVRNQKVWDDAGYKFGVYWDSFGHPGQKTGAWNAILATNTAGRYLSEVVEGEVAYDWGTDTFDPIYGGDPDVTLGSAQFTDNMIDVIRELHCSGLGWIASYSAGNAVIEANADRMQKEFGYRFVLPEFRCSSRGNQGGTINVGFKVKNVGSAPFMENWKVAFVLIDEVTRQIVWKQVLPGIDVSSWQPGSDYNKTTKVYDVAAREYNYNKTITVPTAIPTGKYLAGIAVLEPSTDNPGLFFSVNNFFKESQTQPLVRIGIGEDVTNSTVTGRFDNPVTDDTRRYVMSTQVTHTIGSSSGPNGAISPSGNISVNTGTSKTFTIIPNIGYELDKVVVDGSNQGAITSYTFENVAANRTISASFKLVLDPTKPATGVRIDNCPTAGLLLNSTFNLSNILVPINARNQDVIWTSSNPAIATIDAITGLVTAKAVGTARMTVTTVDGNFSASCDISVIVLPACTFPWSRADFTVGNTAPSFSTNLINISCASSVTISMDLSEVYFFDNNDKLSVSYKIDGGAAVLIRELVNDFNTPVSVSVPNISGNTLEIIVNSVNLVADPQKVYFIKNIKVTASNLSVKDNNYETNIIRVYPNPSSSILNIDSDTNSEKAIYVINSMGQLVSSSKSTGNAQIDLQSLNVSGFVIVQVIADGMVSNHKIIVK